MSWNLNGTDSPSLAALAVVKGIRTPLDLCAVTQVVDGEEQRYVSFLSQSVGIVAESDLGTDHLRWMGDARFTWGFLSRLLGELQLCVVLVRRKGLDCIRVLSSDTAFARLETIKSGNANVG